MTCASTAASSGIDGAVKLIRQFVELKEGLGR